MIEAKYGKKCPGCGDDIHEGDEIGVVDGEWVCSNCVESMGAEDGDNE